MKLDDVFIPQKYYKVIVKTITFNHSKYIQDTMNGVAMQITNFPFVNIVLEDHSTDGEQDVIKLWLERECDMSLAEHYDIPTAEVIIVPHKSNRNCTFAVYFHKVNLFRQMEKREAQLYPWRYNSEYEALCEGDDYWTDSLKLQKQVDFLDANPDYSFTSHRCMVFDEILNKWTEYNDVSDYENNKDGIIIDFKYNKPITHTATLLFRVEALSEYLKFVNNGGPSFDFILIYFLKKAGKGFSFNLNMSVYRLNMGGIYGKQSVKTKLSQGYEAMKKLHSTENNNITRKMYYSRYASIFVLSKGMILFQEDFEILKFLSICYYLPLKFVRLLKRKFLK